MLKGLRKNQKHVAKIKEKKHRVMVSVGRVHLELLTYPFQELDQDIVQMHKGCKRCMQPIIHGCSNPIDASVECKC